MQGDAMFWYGCGRVYPQLLSRECRRRPQQLSLTGVQPGVYALELGVVATRATVGRWQYCLTRVSVKCQGKN